MNIIDNDLLSIQEARILAENAAEAQKEMATFSQEKLDEIVEHIADEITKYSRELAILSHEETEYGRWEDKYVKNRFVCEYLRRELRGMRCVGFISEDCEKSMKEVGVPLGVIAALSPATSPVSTTIFKTLIAIKSGNAIVFSPHPIARKVMEKALDIMIDAAHEAGLPDGALTYLHTVTPAGTAELMGHRCTALVMITGVPGMLEAARKSGKPIIFGGIGNGPAFIERTADLDQATKDIITSKTFDNGIVSAAEQSIVVDSVVSPQVKERFIANGGYFMTHEESERLSKLFFLPTGKANPEIVGISAVELAAKAGFSVDSNVKVLLSEKKYISEDNPYAKEKLCPVLAYFIEDDWMGACEKCIELLLSEKQGHTLVIHSKDDEVIRQFALKKPVGRVLVNTPATFGSMGATTNLFPSMTLGSGSAGEGITSDNVSPMNLIYIRKIGYGVRKVDALDHQVPEAETQQPNMNKKDLNTDNIELLHRLLLEAIEGIKGNQDEQ